MSLNTRFTEVSLSKTFDRIRTLFELDKKSVLDLGCGYGEYLALCGEGSLGITSNQEEVKEAIARGLSVMFGNIEELDQLNLKKSFAVVWANNFFEHLLSPHAFLMNLKPLSKEGSFLILGVPVFPRILSLMHFSKWKGALASNHINFFTKETLCETVERAGWRVLAVRPFFFKNKTLDYVASFFAPHLYVVAHNESTFTYPPKKLMEWKGNSFYSNLLKITQQE